MFKILELPRYLVVHAKRFTKNKYFTEKNNTVITFPIKGLDLSEIATKVAEGGDCCKYSLLANIIHDGDAKSGGYRVQVKHKALENKWFDVQDLHVNEILPQ